MNNVVLVGRLTKDPELRYLSSGTPVATFTESKNKATKNEEPPESPTEFAVVDDDVPL